jgi:hypothetical protein
MIAAISGVAPKMLLITISAVSASFLKDPSPTFGNHQAIFRICESLMVAILFANTAKVKRSSHLSAKLHRASFVYANSTSPEAYDEFLNELTSEKQAIYPSKKLIDTWHDFNTQTTLGSFKAVLFEYENDLRMEKGLPLLPLTDFPLLTIEHIVPQECANYQRSTVNKKFGEWIATVLPKTEDIDNLIFDFSNLSLAYQV